MNELLSVGRIYGGYAVITADTRLDDTDLLPGTIIAAFATEADARRYADWLMLLRAGFHGATPAHL